MKRFAGESTTEKTGLPFQILSPNLKLRSESHQYVVRCSLPLGSARLVVILQALWPLVVLLRTLMYLLLSLLHAPNVRGVPPAHALLRRLLALAVSVR